MGLYLQDSVHLHHIIISTVPNLENMGDSAIESHRPLEIAIYFAAVAITVYNENTTIHIQGIVDEEDTGTTAINVIFVSAATPIPRSVQNGRHATFADRRNKGWGTKGLRDRLYVA